MLCLRSRIPVVGLDRIRSALRSGSEKQFSSVLHKLQRSISQEWTQSFIYGHMTISNSRPVTKKYEVQLDFKILFSKAMEFKRFYLSFPVVLHKIL